MTTTSPIAALPVFDPVPVTLRGTLVRLEPLTIDHAPRLAGAVDPAAWRWMPVAPPDDPAQREDFLRRWIPEALGFVHAGGSVVFVTVRASDDTPVGSTRFLNIDRANRVLEIGYTWLHPSAQRTGINTQAKLLQLTHAFDTLGAIRVEFRADASNTPSRTAIERLGARLDGTLRHHRIRRDGTLRDTVVYSILRDEWPAVRERLTGFLSRHNA
jgi:RimJ/RimL family protein N-acetyltransferase